MRIDFLSGSEKKKIIEMLEEQHGISKINHLMLRTGKERVRGYTGSLSKDEIKKLNSIIRIESIGLYLMKEEAEIRLSIDGCYAFSRQIDKNTVEIDEEQKERWMRGENLDIESGEGIKVVLFKGLILGSGKAGKGKLVNFVPKERRVKN